MNNDERAVYAALPVRVTVYRGVNDLNGVSGMSWTLDRERAEWFALRFTVSGAGYVCAGTARRERILAYLDERSEREVVVFPRYVYARRWTPMPPGSKPPVLASKADGTSRVSEEGNRGALTL